MRSLKLWLIVFVCVMLVQIASGQRTGGGGGGRGTGGGGSKASSGPRVVPNPTYQPTIIPSHPTVHHADEEGPLEFKTETFLIQVPVVVVDKAGNHVAGLSRSDFEVLENGKQQKISSFEEIQPSSVPLKIPEVRGGEYCNLAATAEAPRSITIIALDSINTPFLDQTYGRKQLIKYLADNVQPGQVFALVAITGRGLKVIHNLTADPAELIRALQKVNGEMPALQGVDIDVQATAASGTELTNGSNFLFQAGSTESGLQDFLINGDATIARMQQDRAIEGTMRAFLDIAWSVSGIPGKKALVWATAGFPFFLDGPSSIPGGYLSVLYERSLAALNQAEVSVYPVDVRGLVNYLPSSDASQRGARGGSSYLQSLSARSWLQTTTLDTLKDFAAMTGGRAFYNGNDLATSFRRAAEDSSSYYLLGYYLDTQNTKPGWRNLKVKVHRPNTEVRARNGFFVTNATINPQTAYKTDMSFALTSPLDSTGIPVTMRWKTTTADGAKKKIEFSLHMPPDAITLLRGAKTELNFDVGFIATASKTGVTADSYGQTVSGTPNPQVVAKLKAEGLAYNNSLELAPGDYTVRFVVRDNLNGKVGTLTVPLSVN